MLKLGKGSKILFEGDSVTDHRRDREDFHSLSAYSKIIGEKLSECGGEAFNRAIGGDRSKDVLARIKGEFEELRPNVFSLLIGVNDTWRRYDNNDPTSEEQFEKNLRVILETAYAYCAKIIVLEPFILPSDPQKMIMREDLTKKIDVVRKLARDFADEYVPLDGLFAELALKISPEELAADGIHPTDLAYEYIARWWMERVTFSQ